MTIREARAAAVRRWWRDLQDDLSRGLPRLLDALDEIDARQAMPALEGLGPLKQHLADGGTVEIGPPGPGPLAPTDAEISAWIEGHPAEFEAWVARQNRINGTTATQPSRQAGRRTPRSTKQT